MFMVVAAHRYLLVHFLAVTVMSPAIRPHEAEVRACVGKFGMCNAKVFLRDPYVSLALIVFFQFS